MGARRAIVIAAASESGARSRSCSRSAARASSSPTSTARGQSAPLGHDGLGAPRRPDELARRIRRAIERDEARVVLPAGARPLAGIVRIAPRLALRLGQPRIRR